LYYTLLAGNNIYKIDINNLRKCSELNESETDKLTQSAGTLSGQTAAIASEQCAIFFSNIPETSILCQDASKKFESDNTVRYLNTIFFHMLLDNKLFQIFIQTNYIQTNIVSYNNNCCYFNSYKIKYQFLGDHCARFRKITICSWNESCKWNYDTVFNK